MSFNTLQFFIFFPAVVITYFLIPFRIKWLLLLLASYFFYMCWVPKYVALVAISTLIAYIAGLWMGRSENQVRRKRILIFSIVSNIGILFIFKYFNFFNDTLKIIFNYLDLNYTFTNLNLLLPIGISFYTFQILSYSIDVYRGNKTPEKHLGIFALYVSFFPQLVAGPIERSTRLLPQFFSNKNFDYERVSNGLKLMLWGFFKKIVIADRLGIIVDKVYNSPTDYTGMPLILSTYFFAFQIFCDFSGYSDIAIGSAQVMGFKLMDNFRRPYFANSIQDFWRRWHISLSSWFRDYVYIPLGGNRVAGWRWQMNIIIVFLITGLWHGANWTFVFWGGLHGFYMLFSNWTKDTRKIISEFFYLDRYPKVGAWFRVIVTFHLAVFAWIFFRANSIDDAFYIVGHLFAGLKFETGLGLGLKTIDLVIIICFILVLETAHFIQRSIKIRQLLVQKPILLRWSAYYFLIVSIILFGEFGTHNFIYFQF